MKNPSEGRRGAREMGPHSPGRTPRPKATLYSEFATSPAVRFGRIQCEQYRVRRLRSPHAAQAQTPPRAGASQRKGRSPRPCRRSPRKPLPVPPLPSRRITQGWSFLSIKEDGGPPSLNCGITNSCPVLRMVSSYRAREAGQVVSCDFSEG